MSKLLRVAVFALCLAPLVQAQEAVPIAPRVGLGAEMTVEGMAAQADSVVIGKCIEVTSAWSDPRHLVTLARVSVIEVMKGESSGEVTVVLPGGIDLNRQFPIAMTYPGAPQIGTGENVFLFLMNDSDVAGGQTVVGFSQGKFSVVTDDGGQQFVSRDRIDKVNVTTSNGLPRGTRQLTPMSEFKEKVRAGLN